VSSPATSAPGRERSGDLAERISAISRRRPPAASLSLGAAPLLALVSAGGLVLVALGNNAARDGDGGAGALFWTGLVVIFAPIALRLLAVSASRAERIALVLILGLSVFIAKLLYSPNEFVFYDELGWWRATHDLLHTGHPFSSNPLVISTPGFPGTSLLAGALVQLAGLSIFHAGTIIIGVMRAALMLGLFLLLERVTQSSRAAGIGAAVYACNPSFLYFNTQFAYESIGLLIAIALLLLTARLSEADDLASLGRAGPWLLGAIAVLALTLTITHHMTSYVFFVFLLVWGVFALAGDRLGPVPNAEAVAVSSTGPDPGRRFVASPMLPALFLGLSAAVWFASVAGDVTIRELGGVFSGAFRSVVDLIFGSSGPKKPFQAGGQSNTLAAKALAIGSVIPLLLIIPLGLKRIFWDAVSTPLQRTLALLPLVYIFTLGLRATQGGTEISQRASPFVFIGLAMFAAVLVNEMRWPKKLGNRTAIAFALTGIATTMFLGGFIIGEPSQGRQPGSYLVVAERRSVSAQGLAAARFAARALPPGSRILVDHANAILFGSYGELDPVSKRVDGTPVTEVFLPKTLDAAARKVIRDGRIDYIVVDNRLARTPPVGGYYFGRSEPRAFRYEAPIRRAALRKFHLVEGLTKVYGNGVIAIYDTSGLRSQ
jgi:hypothetical protein